MTADTPNAHRCILPGDALEDIRQYVENAPVKSWVREATMTLARLTLPPADAGSLAESARLIRLLAPTEFPLTREELGQLGNAWEAIANADESGEHAPRHLATRYPLHFSLKVLSRTPPLRNRPVLSALHIQMCTAALSDHNVTRSVYYHDVLAIRDVFGKGLHHLDPDMELPASLEGATAFLLERLDRIANLSDDGETTDSVIAPLPEKGKKNWLGKMERLAALLSGERVVGRAERRRTGAPGRRPGERTVVTLTTEPDRLDPKESGALLDGAEVDLYEEEQVHSSPAESTLESAELVKSERYLQRAEPPEGSRLTTADDRRALSGRMDAMAAKNVVSITDLHRPSLPTVANYLRHLAELDERLLAWAWLAVGTGMGGGRLTDMVLAATTAPCVGNEVQFIPDESLLVYRVREGATDFFRPENDATVSDPTHMQLVLPVEISDALSRALTHDGAPQWIARANAEAARFSKTNAGPTPTLEHLAAAFWTLVAPPALTPLEAATVSGSIPARLRGQANYYGLSRAEINREFRRAHECFGSKWAAGFTNFRITTPLHFPSALPPGTVGSQLAAPLSDLNGLFLAIAERHQAVYAELRLLRPDERLHGLVDLMNLEYLQLYLLEQCALGLRPIGGVASAGIGDRVLGACIADKGNALFTERSLTPVLPCLDQTLERVSSDFDRLQHYFADFGIQVERKEDGKDEGLALVLEITPSQAPSITVARMTGSRFAATLEALGLAEHAPPARNITRHMLASALHDYVPPPLLDEFLHHKREGLDFCSPWSTASTNAFQAFGEILNRLLSQLAVRPLTLGALA